MSSRTRILVIGTFVLVTFAEMLTPQNAVAVERLNFLFILADDLGCRDLSGEGSTYYESPHIDHIAQTGMRFTNGYAACRVCSPSRASILLGKFPARHGITDWIGAATGLDWKRNGRVLPAEYARHLPHADVTIAEALQAAGYATFFAGKWHLGSDGSLPEDHGFQINQGGFESGSPRGGYFAPWENPKLPHREAGEALPDRLASETISFIESSRDEPFFAFLSFYSVHGPIQTTQSLWSKYQRKAAPHEGDRFRIDRTLPVRQVQDNPIYAGMVESMDTAIGRVLNSLRSLDIEDKTVIIFTSDNGGVSSGDAYSSCNLPWRGGKGRQWEGGIREPYYLVVPGMTTAGSNCTTAVTGTDFYPTILELAGLPLMPTQHADGVSLLPLVKGQPIADRALIWHYPHYGNQGGEPSSVIRREPWKLIHYWEDGRDELYHLPQDTSEAHDAAAAHPDVVRRLRRELDAYLAEVGAAIPEPDDRFDEARFRERQAKIEGEVKQGLEREHARYLQEDWRPNETWWDSQPEP